MKWLEPEHTSSPFGGGMAQSLILPLDFHHGHSFVVTQPRTGAVPLGKEGGLRREPR